jgi:antitoxin (DNA-binding transcriptional repressor) of toxin-antitoxin stability system
MRLNLVRAKIMQVSLTEAAASLSELVKAAISGEEVIILLNDGGMDLDCVAFPQEIGNYPAIRLIPLESVRPNRKPGSAKGLIWMSDDFDEPLEEFREYTE